MSSLSWFTGKEKQWTVYTSKCYVRNAVDSVNKQVLCTKCSGQCKQAGVVYEMQYTV